MSEKFRTKNYTHLLSTATHTVYTHNTCIADLSNIVRTQGAAEYPPVEECGEKIGTLAPGPRAAGMKAYSQLPYHQQTTLGHPRHLNAIKDFMLMQSTPFSINEWQAMH